MVWTVFWRTPIGRQVKFWRWRQKSCSRRQKNMTSSPTWKPLHCDNIFFQAVSGSWDITAEERDVKTMKTQQTLSVFTLVTRASKNWRPRQNAPLGVMLNFDARVKNSDAAQPRVTNVKTPIAYQFNHGHFEGPNKETSAALKQQTVKISNRYARSEKKLTCALHPPSGITRYPCWSVDCVYHMSDALQDHILLLHMSNWCSSH